MARLLNSLPGVNGTEGNVQYGDLPISIITGTSGADALAGDASKTSLIYGLDGNDTLVSGPFADTLVGGPGDDIYAVNNPGDTLVEEAGEGWDTVNSAVSYVLPPNIEILNLTGTGSLNGTGNDQGDGIAGNSGNNILTGGEGADTIIGGGGTDSLYGGGGADKLSISGPGNNALYGGTGNDTLSAAAGTGNNKLDGGTGFDAMAGGAGNDTFIVDNSGDTVTEQAGKGIDTILSSVSYTLSANVENLTLAGAANINATGNAAANTLTGNDGNNTLDDSAITSGAITATLKGGGGADTLKGGAGGDSLDGGTGADSLSGGAGNDTYFIDNQADTITEASGGGTDAVFSSISYALPNHVEKLTLTGTAYRGMANAAGSVLIGNDGVNLLVGGAGNDSLDGGKGVDSLAGGAGDDSYTVDNTQDTITEAAGGGTDTVSSPLSWTLGPNLENLTLTGTLAINGTGNDGGDTGGNRLTGNIAANTLTGGAGADRLDGGLGADTLKGGDGDDTYVVDNPGDAVSEGLGGGTDTVSSSVSYTLPANIENLVLTGASAFKGFGNSGNNILTGSDAANTLTGLGGDDTLYGGGGSDILVTGTGKDVLDGGAGNDSMTGGAGDDRYYVDNAGDTVTEKAGEGVDTVFTSLPSYTLSANLENLVLQGGAYNGTGNSGDNVITGNDNANRLVGGAGNDSIDGGANADAMAGGPGDDTYVVDNALDTVTENSGEGSDTVVISQTFNLATNASNIENLILSGTGNIDGTGDGGDNSLRGNTGANQLDGGAGQDTLYGGGGSDLLIGGDGDDTYLIDATSTAVTLSETATGGIDTVLSSISYALSAGSNIEKLTLGGVGDINGSGDSGNNVITGNSGNNTLAGGGGTDTLAGGTGNDTYLIDAASTAVTLVETAAGGVDTVLSSITYALSAGSNIENLALAGTGDINATGDSGNNAITGNSGDNTLAGGGGADILAGGDGDDTYLIDASSTAATLIETATGGTDTVLSAITHTLGANIENLTLTGTGNINGTGNSGDNIITGNSGNNTLAGGGGTDTLAGGDGNDTYTLASGNTATTLVETSTGGIDTVKSAITYTLGANLENLSLTGSSNINGTGNSGDNVITGNSGNNTLAGGGGTDTLIGGSGNDVYLIDAQSTAVTLVENAAGGTDTVQSSITYALATGSNIENLTLTGIAAINGTGDSGNNTLTGNNAANILNGGAGSDTLSGGGGADTLIGGDGDDTYSISSSSNTSGFSLVETLTGGTDTVKSSITYTLGANFENLTLTGTSKINGTGNSGDNVITGNSSGNVLSGGSGGTDHLAGGNGNDTYLIDAAATAATLTETATGGTDTVQSSVSYALGPGSNLENLVLTGTGSIDGTGNELDNVLNGNAAANRLNGGAGNDSLSGGSGSDTFVYLHGSQEAGGGDTGLVLDDRDIITDFAPGTDKIDLSSLDANPSTPAVEHWTFVTNFTATGPEVRFDAATDPAHPVLVFDYGDGAADFAVELAGVTTLAAADLILS